MYRPPTKPPGGPLPGPPSERSLLVGYAMVVVIPLLLWAASSPLSGAAVLGALYGLVAAGRRATRLVKCFHDCGGFCFEYGGRLRIAVLDPSVETAC